MISRLLPSLLAAGLFVLSPIASHAAIGIVPLGQAHAWRRAEFRLDQVPAAANPFDPDEIQVDATFSAPSGKKTTVPAFWYQDYRRSLIQGVQALTPSGAPEWRIRFTPTEAGAYRVSVAVRLKGSPASEPVEGQFSASAAAGAVRGWVRNGADHRYFETSDGSPLRLIGENVCWAQSNETFDYDAWFAAMAASGQNFARLWMAPWDMGIEHGGGTLNRYRQDAAWSLDHVFSLAEEKGLYVLLCFDHHGMFQQSNRNWGGSNNFWNVNPYNQANGGPCVQPNDFFTSAEARKLYQKRLRYLIARYGYSPNLLSWQFFNEIDNVFAPAQSLVGDDVVAWHRLMGKWLRENDPYGHLISTSLTGGSDRPEFWKLPELDFAVYHSYGDAAPGRKAADVGRDYHQRYGKPVMIGEFGVSARDWAIVSDPHLRGFRQGLWGGALGGSVGTDMSWWWESIHADNVYPLYAAMRDILRQAGWLDGRWTPAEFAHNEDLPTRLGAVRDDAAPFSATVALGGYRRTAARGELALADALAAERASEYLSAFLHGSQNADLQRPLRLSAEFAEGGKISFRVNSVAGDAEVIVTVDGAERLRNRIYDRDGLAAVNHEIDRDLSVDVPAGRHTIEISNSGLNWAFLENLRIENVRPCAYADGWQVHPDVLGLRNEQGRAVVYVTSPYIVWPAGALRYNPPVQKQQTVTLTGGKPGRYVAQWFDPTSGKPVGKTETTAAGKSAVLPLPEYSEDLVGIVNPQ